MIKSVLSASSTELLFLAPQQSQIPTGFHNVEVNTRDHGTLLKEAQRLRGQVYREDQAIAASEVDQYGCFAMEADAGSWHLLLLDKGRVLGCLRFLLHPNPVIFDRLLLRNCTVAQDEHAGRALRKAIAAQIMVAGELGFSYVELGGWALSEEIRGTSAAVKCLLAAYAWGDLVGGCLGVCTATVRHGSASLLSRIGGTPLGQGFDQISPYYDPAYGCEMRILAFDTRTPRAKFAHMVKILRGELPQTSVVVSQPTSTYMPDRWDPAFSTNLRSLRHALTSRQEFGSNEALDEIPTNTASSLEVA